MEKPKLKEFKCTKTTPSSNGGFVNTIKHTATITVTIFNQTHTQESTETYHIKTVKSIPENSTCDLNIEEMFTIKVRDYHTVDKGTGEAITIPCKWLYFK